MTNTSMTTRRIVRALLCSTVAAAPLAAQVQLPAPATTPAITVDAHWLPYLGCWETVADGLRGPMTCLLSTSESQVIELATISGDSAIVRERYDLTGKAVPYSQDGCTGTQVTGWALNERSFHVRTEVTCGNGEPQVSTSVFTMRTETSFVRLQSMKARTTTAVRVIEHRLLDGNARGIRVDVLNRVPSPYDGVVRNARSVALESLTAADVLDASRVFDPALLEAFIAGHGQKVMFGARDLRMLINAGVADRVLDMMVAVSNPGDFTLSAKGEPELRRRAPSTRTPTQPTSASALAMLDLANCLAYGTMYMSSSCGNGYGLYQSCYGYGAYAGFMPLYSSVLTGNSAGYCGDVYRYPRDIVVGYPSSWVGGGTPNANPPAGPPGRVVNGSGYSQGSTSGGSRGPARPSEPVTSTSGYGSAASASVDRGGYSSGSSSGSSAGASSAGSAPRTAKERP